MPIDPTSRRETLRVTLGVWILGAAVLGLLYGVAAVIAMAEAAVGR